MRLQERYSATFMMPLDELKQGCKGVVRLAPAPSTTHHDSYSDVNLRVLQTQNQQLIKLVKTLPFIQR